MKKKNYPRTFSKKIEKLKTATPATPATPD
jgi:hypothetical protein